MSEAELASYLKSILWPLFVGGAAAFAYLILLGAEHRRATALLQLCRDVSALREKHEKKKDDRTHHKIAVRLGGVEEELQALLRRKGLTASAPAPQGRTRGAADPTS